MDRIVIDDFDINMLTPEFRKTVADGLFSREAMHGEVSDLVAGRAGGRESPDERNLIHTVGLVSQDIGVAHHVYRKALDIGAGLRLPLPHAETRG